MADKTVTVKPSGGTYTTLAGAIAGELVANANLVTMEGILHIEIDGDWSGGHDTTAAVVNDFTTSADYYIHIYTKVGSTARNSSPKWVDTKYVLEVSNATALQISDNHVRIDGLQISKAASNADHQAGIYVIGQDAANDIQISNCLVRQAGNASYAEPGIRVLDADAIVKVWNCIVYGMGAYAGSDNSGIICANASSLTVYNSTVYQGFRNFKEAAGTMVVKNCLAMKYTAGGSNFDWDSAMTVDYCASDAGTGTNAQTVNAASDYVAEVVDADGGDFTVQAASVCVGHGVDNPGSGLYSDDITGTARTSTWDIGADEYIAAAGGAGSIPKFWHLYGKRRRG